MMAQLGSVSAQNERPFSDEAESPTTSPKKLEDTVVTDMLRIVDNKFDTLTTRLTSLERAVSNLQFFSIRQFRSVGGALQEVTKGVESLSGQVSLTKLSSGLGKGGGGGGGSAGSDQGRGISQWTGQSL